jgi:hypothetical protein
MSTKLALTKFESLSDLVTIKPEELSDADALAVWSLFDAIEKKIIKERKGTFRDHLFALAEKKGMMNAKGSFEYAPPSSDGKITKQARTSKPKIDYEVLEKELDECGLIDRARTINVALSGEDYKAIAEVLEKHGDKDLLTRFAYSGGELKVDDTKVEALIALGEFPLDALENASTGGDVTYALKVKAPSAIKRLIERE